MNRIRVFIAALIGMLATLPVDICAKHLPDAKPNPAFDRLLQTFKQLAPKPRQMLVMEYASLRLHHQSDPPPRADLPLRIHLTCEDHACTSVVGVLDQLKAIFPDLIAATDQDVQTANIEIFAVSSPNGYETRDAEISAKLKLDTDYSTKASCRQIIHRTKDRHITKSLIFSNSTLPTAFTAACVTIEIARTLGSAGLVNRPLQFTSSAKEWRALQKIAILQLYLDQDPDLDGKSVEEIADALQDKYFSSPVP